jgi:hypothetical protein
MVCAGRWKIALALAGIFVAGVAAGGIAGYAWAPRETRPRMSPDAYTERYLQRMITDVKLTGEQVECLRPMMEEFSEKLSVMRQRAFTETRGVLKEMDRRIEADLTDEQRELYRQMQERDRKQWEMRFAKPPPKSPPPGAGLEPGAENTPPPPAPPPPAAATPPVEGD